MKFVVLGGTGNIGRFVVRDLFESCKNCEIIIASSDEKKASDYAKSFKNKRVRGVKIDVTNINSTSKLLKGMDVAVNCVNYYFNLHVMRACLKAETHYLDLGGLFHFTKKQLKLNNTFKKRRLLAILGCGSTPGITNVMARYGGDLFEKIDEIKVRFASKDYTKYDLPFVVPYSMYTVFDEFTMKPALFTSSRLKMISSQSACEKEVFPDPIGEVECFATLHSELATFPSSFKTKGLRECSFKLAFPKDFVDKINFMINTGLASDKEIQLKKNKIKPRDVTVGVLNNLIPSEKTKIIDLEIVRVELIGKNHGINKKIIIDCLTRSNQKWNASAGIVDTAVPPSIIAQMIAKGLVKERGVLPPELCVDATYFFEELTKRKIEVVTRIEKRVN